MNRGRPTPDGGRRLDLHAHTHFSDGQLSPAELIELAVARQLIALAITDHDTVDGVAPALQAAGDRIEVVPGIEISSLLDGQDLHILGYFLDPTHAPLLERLTHFREERRARAGAILERLRQLGAGVDDDAVFAAAGPGVVGRPHVAQALVRAGHVPSVDVAFQRYLGPRGEAFVPRPAFPSEQAIAIIRAASGVAVLAHPGSAMPVLQVERLHEAGLAGIEVWHPQHNMVTQRRWKETADRLGLIASGGSDFHATHRGAGLGDMPVPERTLDRLRAAARQ